MANIIQTRIKLRNATLTEWNANSGAIIQQGEVALGKITADQIAEGSGSKYEGKESFLDKYEIRIGTSNTSTWASLEPGNLVIPADNVEGLLDKLYEYQLVKTADGKIQFQRRLPGVDAWENVGDAIAVSSQYFEGEKLTTDASDDAAITRILGTYTDKVARDGDTFVLKTKIADGKDVSGDATGAKYSYTAFTRDGGAWKAMDGNYDARNVYMPEDITYTTNVGYLNSISGSTTKSTFDCDGLSVFDAFKKIMSKTIDPSFTKPSYSLACGNITTYTTDSNSTTNKSTTNEVEVGTKVTKVAWNGTFTDGSYSYNTVENGTKSAGCTGSYTMTNNKEATTSTPNAVDGTYTLASEVVIGDGSTDILTVTGNCSYSAAAYTPTNNLGDPVASKKGTAGTLTAQSFTAKLTGFRYLYIGSTADDGPITETVIKGLTPFKATATVTKTVKASGADVKLVSGAKRIIVACPNSTSYADNLTSAILVSAANTPITDLYKQVDSVDISGVISGSNKMSYKVYVYQPTAIDAGEEHKITITK